MYHFTPDDWYWIVGGDGPHKAHADAPFTADETQVYSSKLGAYVPASDPGYQAWRKRLAFSTGWPDAGATRIDSEISLTDVLMRHGLAGVPRPVELATKAPGEE